MANLSQTLILTHSEIEQKITRMAWQILENNHNASRLIIVGVEKKGSIVSELIAKTLTSICEIPVHVGKVWIDKRNPKLEGTRFDCVENVENSNVVLVDDVLNSGRTLMYATLPILSRNPAKLQTAILANRDHTSFPIKADFVGISLATTLQEHIHFTRNEDGEMTVYLS